MADETQVTTEQTEAVDIGGQAEAAEQITFAEPAKPDAGGFFWGVGRRKTAVARVRIRPAKGEKSNFMVNGRRLNDYFTELRDQTDAKAPLVATNTADTVDVYVNVSGGGYMGQAGAILLGVARALKGMDPSLEPVLREINHLTRDPREVERKKYGQRGARRRFQFSKR